MSFTRKKEDFICENCGASIFGNGYTNHCYTCLYSKHVDVSPGDRMEACGGLMNPIYVAYTYNQEYIIHKCIKCGFERRNKIQSNDSVESMSKIQSTLK